MEIKKVIESQYMSSIEMLKQAISACPEEIWDAPHRNMPTWHIAYHALFFIHLYLQDTEEDFIPWEKQHDDEETPYTKDELLAYLGIAQTEVRERIPILDLEAESGFSWLPFAKLELQFYSIRHTMQHVGELYERVGSQIDEPLHWVGKYP